MSITHCRPLALTTLLWLAACQQAPECDAADSENTATADEAIATFQVPVHYSQLDNGLRVILSQDKTTHDVPGLEKSRQDGVHQTGTAQWRRDERLHAIRLHELL